MYTEDYKHNGFFVRKIILKVFLILAIVILLLWLVPQFMSYKPSKKIKSNQTTIKVEQQDTAKKANFTDSLNKIKDAAYVYYTNDKMPELEGDITIVTLKQLIDAKIIDDIYINDKKADIEKSYVKLTKLTDDYLLKASITCDSKTDYLLLHVGEYEYCTDLICEKDDSQELSIEDNNEDDNFEDSDILQDDEDDMDEDSDDIDTLDEEDDDKEYIDLTPNTDTDDNKNNNISSVTTPTLTAFSSWSDWTETSCSTKNVTCNTNDISCLKEIRVKQENKILSTTTKQYSTYSFELKNSGLTINNACVNYNYVKIQGVMYKTTGDYLEVLKLNKTSTRSWKYLGTISTTSTPNFGGTKFYKFAGADYSKCTNTCPNGPSYYYDVYEFLLPMHSTNSLTSDCIGGTGVKYIKEYNVVKTPITVSHAEPQYGTVCYQSSRTRKKAN